MGRYLVRRVVSMVPVVIIVSFLVFALVNVLPGDPALMILGDNNNDPTAYQRLRADLGLDRPLVVRYLDWAGHALIGDFGISLRDRQPIGEVIAARVPPTLELATLGLVLSLCLSIPIGIITALRPGSPVDAVATVLALSGVAVPQFFLGILLIEVFAVDWHLVPPSGYVQPWEDLGANLRLMLLPAIALCTGLTAVQMRHVRSSLLEVLHQEYVLTARAKGLPSSTVVVRHALRNALIPLVTVVGLEMGTLIGGTVILEIIFSIPGMGRLLVDSITFRDYPTVQAMVLLLAFTVLAASLLTDLTYGLLDPRVSHASRSTR
jgi:peptide/nickel transport system permease protein